MLTPGLTISRSIRVFPPNGAIRFVSFFGCSRFQSGLGGLEVPHHNGLLKIYMY